MESLIPATDHAVLWALIAIGTALSIWLEQTYRWAARLSGPVLALLIAMLLSNTEVMPKSSPAYDFVGDWLVPLAIPLLLFRADIREIIRAGGRLFLVFHVAAVGTLLGTAAAFLLLRPVISSPDLELAAGMMAASYIGGGVNFMAMKASYDIPEMIANPLIVADNFVMAAMFVALLAMAGSRWFRARFPHPHSLESTGREGENLAAAHWRRKGISLLDVARSLAFAFTVLAIATLLGRGTAALFPEDAGAGLVRQMIGILLTNQFVLLTVTSLALASLLGKHLKEINGPEEFGTYLLCVFLFTLGLPADLLGVLRQAPLFFVFCAIIAVVNLVFTLGVGKLLRQNLEELLLVVNASLGGAPSAAAMATSAGWPRLIVPALLAGIWGYVIGTPLGVMTLELLSRAAAAPK